MPPPVRHAARAVLLAPTGRVLLLRHAAAGAPYWAAPGGGLEPGERHEEGLRRELREETGIEAELGPCLWEDRFLLPDGVRTQVQRFYLARLTAEAPPAGVEAFHRVEGITAARWWSIEELEAADEPIYPRGLAGLLRRLRADGPPPAPVTLR